METTTKANGVANLSINEMLDVDGEQEYKECLIKAIDLGLEFKNQTAIKKCDIEQLEDIICIRDDPENFNEVISILKNEIIPRCSNFSSPNFMGFPDSGNSLYALFGAILSEFLQQNLINSSFCAPSATLIEIQVLQYMRKTLGYPIHFVKNIWDVGGIITVGGTCSNTIAMLLARENHRKNTMLNGINNPEDYKIIIPKGIGHYSIKSSQMWIGCGNNVIEVKTKNYRYDLKELQHALKENNGKVMAVIAYAGDSRTMSIENLEAVYHLVKRIDTGIWLHADACNGFCLSFNTELKKKISGIELFDSITCDPHKMLEIPYTISALFVKEQGKIKSILSESDLIMKEPLAFGQITPFIGSKSWMSLKLWTHFKTLGGKGLSDRIFKRYELAQLLKSKLENNCNFQVLNDVDAFSVVFLYKNQNMGDIDTINIVNKKIHQEIIRSGKIHLHSFPVFDNKEVLSDNELIYPLRFFSGNHLLNEEILDDMIQYVEKIGVMVEREID